MVTENRIVVLGEDRGSLGLEKPSRVFLCFLGCSVGAWKMRMLRAEQTMEAGLVAFQREDSIRAAHVVRICGIKTCAFLGLKISCGSQERSIIEVKSGRYLLGNSTQKLWSSRS